MAKSFSVLDRVKLVNGPTRYNDRVGTVTRKFRRGVRTFYEVDFSPRRATPFVLPAGKLAAV